MGDINLFKTVLQQVESDRSDRENLCHTLAEEKARIKKYKQMTKECEKDIDCFRARIDELKVELKENNELIEKYNSCSKKLLNSTSLIKTALVIVEEYASVFEKNAEFDNQKRVDLIESNSKLFKQQLKEYQQSPEAVKCKNLEKSLEKLKFEAKYLNHELESKKRIKESLKNLKRTMLFTKINKLYETLKTTYKHIEIDQKIRDLKLLYEKKLQETAIDYNANEVIPMEICSQKTNFDIPSDLSQIKSLELNIEESDFTKTYNDFSLSEVQLSSQQSVNLEQNSYIDAIYQLYEDYLSIKTDDHSDKLKITLESNSNKKSLKTTLNYSDKENMPNCKKICTEQSKNVAEIAQIDTFPNNSLKPKLISEKIINLSMETDAFDLTSLEDENLTVTEISEPKSIVFEGIHNITDCNKIITDDQIFDINQTYSSDIKDYEQGSEISSLHSMKSYEKSDSDFLFISQEIPLQNTRKTAEKSVTFDLFKNDDPNLTQKQQLPFLNKPSSETNNNIFNFMGSKQKQQTKKSFF